MTYPIQPYQNPPTQLPGPPSEFNLGGNKYMLVPAEQQAPVVPYQHHQGPVISGVPYVMTHEGYRPAHLMQDRPYHAHQAHPPWLRNHYSRGTGILIGAACIGTVLFCVAAALFAVVTWVVGHLIVVGVTILMMFFGLMMLLGGLTKMHHGHKPLRR